MTMLGNLAQPGLSPSLRPPHLAMPPLLDLPGQSPVTALVVCTLIEGLAAPDERLGRGKATAGLCVAICAARPEHGPCPAPAGAWHFWPGPFLPLH